MRKIEAIGFDGRTYFCKLCWKAGFQTPAQVIGHLSQCPKRQRYLTIQQTQQTQIQQKTKPTFEQYVISRLDKIEQRLSHLENHYHHMAHFSRASSNSANLEIGFLLVILGLGFLWLLKKDDGVEEAVWTIGKKLVDRGTRGLLGSI